MDDRISDPWGERTPYGAGEDWPVPVGENAPAEVLPRYLELPHRKQLDHVAFAMALEDALGRTVLPIGRRGAIDAEPGVRAQL